MPTFSRWNPARFPSLSPFTQAVGRCPGQGLNPSHSSDPIHCRNDAGSLTHGATRELSFTTFYQCVLTPKYFFNGNYSPSLNSTLRPLWALWNDLIAGIPNCCWTWNIQLLLSLQTLEIYCMEEGWDGLGIWGSQMQTLTFRMETQWGPAVQHRELHPISWDRPWWKRMIKR